MNPNRFLSGMMVLLVATAVNGGVVLYDNGAFTTGDGTEFCIEASPPANTSSPTGLNTTMGANTYLYAKRQIDDFTVPAGEAWTLDVLRWRAYQIGTLYDADIAEAYVRLWVADPVLGGAPLTGDLTTNRRINSFFTQVFRTLEDDLTDCNRAIKNVDIDLSGFPTLPPGSYWLEVGLGSGLPGGLFSPPTEPRAVGDNALQTDFSGVAVAAVDGGSGLPLEYPFQLFGTSGPVNARACVLPNETCLDTTLDDCINVHGGVWNYLNACSELGACCDHATGECVDLVGLEACTKLESQFSPGVDCSSVLNCGLINGACCYPNDTPTECQGFTRGIVCDSQGGFWHSGTCTTNSCNDFCDTPDEVSDGDTFFDVTGYSTDGPPTPNNCDNDPFVGRSDGWFTYVSSLTNPNGSISFSLCVNTAYDSTLQVYQVGGLTDCDDLLQTALASYCDNDGCGTTGGPSEVIVPAQPGDQFWIRIGGHDDDGNGMLRIVAIENGFGACCLLDDSCAFTDEANCLANAGGFTPASTCETAGFACPAVGACCRGTDGCEVAFEPTCAQLGGTFLGEGEVCGAVDDCDADGETDLCALASGSPDCDGNGLPDVCDIGPGGGATDCDSNQIPDSCQLDAFCCRGDVNGDSEVNALDIQGFVEGVMGASPACFTRPFCRLDTNADFALDQGDVSAFVSALLTETQCPILVHVTGRVDILDENQEIIGHDNQVFVLDQSGDLIYSYDQVPDAAADLWGYRDGASDGTYLYFGWIGGVGRHDYDGGNGVQIIFGAVPGTGATWRALACNPNGDGGNGSFWTQSFTSDLVETDMAGNLLNQFPNDLSLYGLAFDRKTGMLWGHGLDGDNSALVVEIDPNDGLPTGVNFSSHYNVPGISNPGFALYGGLSMDGHTGKLFGLLQGTPDDAIFSATTLGGLVGSLSPNPRVDINQQTGTIRNLGIVISRP